MIKIYGVPASRTSRCLWMLEEVGVPYENIPTHFVGDAQKPEYLKINPNGRVPALDDDGLILFESLAINLHLARKYGNALWPASADDQARAIQWSIWAMTEVEPPAMRALMNRAFLPEPQRNAAEGDAGERALEKPVRVLDAVLADRPYLLGDHFTVADLNVHAVLGLAPTLGRCKLDYAPNVKAWLARCADRPGFKRAMALLR